MMNKNVQKSRVHLHGSYKCISREQYNSAIRRQFVYNEIVFEDPTVRVYIIKFTLAITDKLLKYNDIAFPVDHMMSS